VRSYVEDSSAEFIFELPAIIQRAEDRVLRDTDPEDLVETVSGTFIGDAGSMARPIGLLAVRSVFTTLLGFPLSQKTREWIRMTNVGTRRDAPRWFYVADAVIEYAPMPSFNMACSITGPVRPTPMSVGNQSGYTITRFPEMLLAATMAESELFLKDAARAQQFEGFYQGALARWNTSQGRVRAPAPTAPAIIASGGNKS
jgi:hypothetical protein